MLQKDFLDVKLIKKNLKLWQFQRKEHQEQKLDQEKPSGLKKQT
jgi:hypothetical protein